MALDPNITQAPLTFVSSGSSAGLSSRTVCESMQHHSSSRNKCNNHILRLAGKAGICKAARSILINLEQPQTILGDSPHTSFQGRCQEASRFSDQRRAGRLYQGCGCSCSTTLQRQRWVRAKGLQACLLPGGYKWKSAGAKVQEVQNCIMSFQTVFVQ